MLWLILIISHGFQTANCGLANCRTRPSFELDLPILIIPNQTKFHQNRMIRSPVYGQSDTNTQTKEIIIITGPFTESKNVIGYLKSAHAVRRQFQVCSL